MIPQTLQKAWAVFIYRSFISPPPPCCFCLFRKKICIRLCTDGHTTHRSRPRESLVLCVLFFCPRLTFRRDSPMPRKARGIPISGASPELSSSIWPPYLHHACEGISKSFPPSPLGGTGRQIEKLLQRGKIQAGRAVHARLHACRERGSTITHLISLGNQIKKQSTLCKL